MKFSADLHGGYSLLALQFAPRNTFVAKAQKSENTDGTSSNATLDAKYSSRVRTAPSQLCPRDLNREGVRIQVEQDIHSILHNKILPQLKLEGNSETNPAASCNELLGRGQNSGYRLLLDTCKWYFSCRDIL